MSTLLIVLTKDNDTAKALSQAFKTASDKLADCSPECCNLPYIINQYTQKLNGFTVIATEKDFYEATTELQIIADNNNIKDFQIVQQIANWNQELITRSAPHEP